MATLHNPQDPAGSLTELRAFLKSFDTVLLVTVTPDRRVRARPMALQDLDALPGCDLWFVTGDDSPKVGEIAGDDQVNVCCYRGSDRAYVSISARARVERNPAEVQRLWQESWRSWFPAGPQDPHIALLKLDVERAEYWEPEGGRLRVLYEMLKARMTHEPASLALNPPKHV